MKQKGIQNPHSPDVAPSVRFEQTISMIAPPMANAMVINLTE